MTQSVVVDMILLRTKLQRSYYNIFLCILFLVTGTCSSARLRRETSNNAEEPQNSPSKVLEMLPLDTYVYENGFCILRCKITEPEYIGKVSVVWTWDGADKPIARNLESYDEKYSLAYNGDESTFEMKIHKVSKQDNGSVFSCLIYNDTNFVDNNPKSKRQTYNSTESTQTLLKSARTSLQVLKSPGIEYPKCSGKPVNYPVKTFVLSCCSERTSTSRFILQWKYRSGYSISGSKPQISNQGNGEFCVNYNVAASHNGASYTCHLTGVGNVQGLNRTCKLQYQKPSVSLTQMDSKQAKFKCSAPYADKYTWSLGDESNTMEYNKLSQSGSSVMILNLDSVHNGTFITCTASLGNGEVMGSDGIMLIMGRPSAKEQSMTLILGIVMGIVAALLAIILVIYLIKMNALQKCCGENEFPSLEFRTIVRMRPGQSSGNNPSSYYVVQSTTAGTSSMHPLMAERDSSNSRLSTSGYQSDNDSLQAGGAVGGVGFPGNYYELRKPPRPGGPLRGATSRDYYNEPGPRTPPRPPKPGLTDPRKLNVEGLDYADLDLVNVAEEDEDVPTKLPEEQTDYADILRIPSLRHASIS